MGMFDNITVDADYQLPLNDHQYQQVLDRVNSQTWHRRFQTKDLENLLDYYEIDSQGLLRQVHDDGSKQTTDLTTTIQFYDYITSEHMSTDLNVCFEALVIDGQVLAMKLISFEEQDNTNRRAATQEWIKHAQQLEQRHSRVLWKVYHYLYAIHINWCLHQLYRLTGWIRARSVNQWRKQLLFWD